MSYLSHPPLSKPNFRIFIFPQFKFCKFIFIIRDSGSIYIFTYFLLYWKHRSISKLTNHIIHSRTTCKTQIHWFFLTSNQILYKVDPWTIWVLTVQAHLYIDFLQYIHTTVLMIRGLLKLQIWIGRKGHNVICWFLTAP